MYRSSMCSDPPCARFQLLCVRLSPSAILHFLIKVIIRTFTDADFGERSTQEFVGLYVNLRGSDSASLR